GTSNTDSPRGRSAHTITARRPTEFIQGCGTVFRKSIRLFVQPVIIHMVLRATHLSSEKQPPQSDPVFITGSKYSTGTHVFERHNPNRGFDVKELVRYISDLRDLDLKDISSWPPRAQRLLIAGMILLAAAFCICYIILPDQTALSESRHTERQLKHVFSTKRQSAAQLTAYQQRLATLKHRFQALQASMPDKNQTATVLGLITGAATANGLHRTSIKPDTAVRENFYTKQPVQMVMTGTFLQFARFVSDTTDLP